MALFSAGSWRASARTDYALRALVEIAGSMPAKVMPAPVIAQSQQIPMPFLNNILRDLRRAGLVVSKRGVGGGWSLARSAAEITVAQVIAVIDGLGEDDNRAAAPPARRDGSAAVVDDLWASLRSSVEGVLGSTTLRDLLLARDEQSRPGA